MKPVEAKSRGTDDAWVDREIAKRTAIQARRAGLLAMLTRRHVSPAIIERVERLSYPYDEGRILRGIHYTTNGDKEPVWLGGFWRKGEFIRKHGAEAWRDLPRRSIMKRGRREYVTREAVVGQLWPAA